MSASWSKTKEIHYPLNIFFLLFKCKKNKGPGRLYHTMYFHVFLKISVRLILVKIRLSKSEGGPAGLGLGPHRIRAPNRG